MKTIIDYTSKLKSYFMKKPTVTSQTLIAGNTSVTFSGIPTSGNFLIDFYTSTGIDYTNLDLSVSGSATLTYPVQAGDVTVFCEIKEV